MTAAADLDPRTKLFLTGCLSAAAVFLSHWAFLSGIFAFSCLLLLIFAVNPWTVFKKTRRLLDMIVLIALLQSIFMPGGQGIVMIGEVNLLTTGGLTLAAEFVLRMLIIVTSAAILSTSSSREIIQGLVQMKMPYELAFMTAMGVRFLPIFAEEFKSALIAIQLRGVNLKALPWGQKTEVMVSLLQPVAAGALIKSKAIAMSIEMRGFRAGSRRTSYLVLSLSKKDYGVMLGGGLLTVAVFVGYGLLS